MEVHTAPHHVEMRDIPALAQRAEALGFDGITFGDRDRNGLPSEARGDFGGEQPDNGDNNQQDQQDREGRADADGGQNPGFLSHRWS